MKRTVSIILALVLIVSGAFVLASCKKKQEPVNPDKFDGLNLAEESDPSNTYSFEGGVYTEIYKGSTTKGEYQMRGEKLYLTPYNQNYNYAYDVEYDEEGNVIRLTQIEGRSFSVVTGEKKK